MQAIYTSVRPRVASNPPVFASRASSSLSCLIPCLSVRAALPQHRRQLSGDVDLRFLSQTRIFRSASTLVHPLSWKNSSPLARADASNGALEKLAALIGSITSGLAEASHIDHARLAARIHDALSDMSKDVKLSQISALLQQLYDAIDDTEIHHVYTKAIASAIYTTASPGLAEHFLSVLQSRQLQAPIAVYNSLLEAFVKEDRFGDVVAVVSMLQSNGISPNACTLELFWMATCEQRYRFREILKACVEYSALDLLAFVLKQAQKHHMPLTVGDYQIVIAAYIKSGELPTAATYLDEAILIGEPDLDQARTILSYYAAHGNATRCESIIRDMNKNHPRLLDIGVLEVYLEACSRSGDAERVNAVLRQLRKLGRNTKKMIDLTIRTYARSGRLREAEAILRENFTGGLRPDYWSYRELIIGWTAAGSQANVQRLLNYMSNSGIRVGDAIVSGIYKALLQLKQPKQVEVLKAALPRIRLHVPGHNWRLFAVAQRGDLAGARVIVNEMNEKQIAPDTGTENALMMLFAQRADPDSAMAIAHQLGFKSPYVHASLLIALINSDDLSSAVSHLDKLCQQDIEITSLCWNVILAEHIRRKDYKGGIKAFHRMQRSQRRGWINLGTGAVDLITCSHLFRLLAASGHWDEAMQIFQTGRSFILAGGGRRRMTDHRVLGHAASSLFNAVIHAYIVRKDPENARRVFNDMGLCRVEPDSVSYSLRMELHAERGEYTEIERLRKQMLAEDIAEDIQHHTARFKAAIKLRAKGSSTISPKIFYDLERGFERYGGKDAHIWTLLLSSNKNQGFWAVLRTWNACFAAGLSSPQAWSVVVNSASLHSQQILGTDQPRRTLDDEQLIQHNRIVTILLEEYQKLCNAGFKFDERNDNQLASILARWDRAAEAVDVLVKLADRSASAWRQRRRMTKQFWSADEVWSAIQRINDDEQREIATQKFKKIPHIMDALS